MYHAIVFLPLVGFLIAGLFGRVIGARPSEIITTALLGVSAVLSWVAFIQVGFGDEPMVRVHSQRPPVQKGLEIPAGPVGARGLVGVQRPACAPGRSRTPGRS